MKKIYLILSTLFILSNPANAQLDSIYNQGEYRTFIVHEPTGYSPSSQYPLVLNLHGLGSSATFQQNYTQFDAVADSLGFIVVYPNGISNSWSTIGNSDVDFLSSLVDSIHAEYSTNNCLFVTGFSQGGFMTYKFANNTPHTVTAVAVGSGNMSFALQNGSASAPQIPVMHFHGTEDKIVSYDGTVLISPVDSTVQWWVNHNNCNTTPVFSNITNSNLSDGSTVEKYSYGGGSNGSEVTFYKVIGGGHTWSGATPIPTFGATNQDMNQSAIIGSFFANFCSGTLGVSKEINKVSISLYPNPFENQLIVQCASNSEYTFILYDNLSRIKLKETFFGNSTIYTDELPNGIYYYEIGNTEKQAKTGKLIKK
jgi:polyhydroxybutyrate depolymerase